MYIQPVEIFAFFSSFSFKNFSPASFQPGSKDMEETSRGRNIFSPFRYTFHIPLFGVVSQKQSRADGRIKALIRATGVRETSTEIVLGYADTL